MIRYDEAYMMEQLEKLMAIDSTVGYYRPIQDYLVEEITRLGYEAKELTKGGVMADLGGEGDPLVVMAHVDDIGLMVRGFRSNGALKVVPAGGLREEGGLNENIRLYTRNGHVYTGVIRRNHSCVHVQPAAEKVPLDYDSNVEVVLDEDVHTEAETRALGIQVGDMICLESRFTCSNGYIKSRFIDDKACAAVLLTMMKYLKEANITPSRKVTAFFTMYEEIGHGGAWIPEGTKDVLALDIAPVSPTQESDERKVSIFAKDAKFPYHYEMITELVQAAERAGADYVMDIFTPSYATDADYVMTAGFDARHAAIGPGTMGSHSYERTHKDGLKNLYLLLTEYCCG